jgi:type IV secretory pathway VirD2 relaxase
MYAKNTVAGQWRAHGRYVARESATQEGDPKAVGFDGRGESIDIAERLESWQKAGDERLWKLIVSPEFGDRADLKRLTRDLASRMEKDVGMPLEWVAVAHYNTDHRMCIWRFGESAPKAARCISAGITSNWASAKSLKISAPAS